MEQLRAGDAVLAVDPADGGRWTSLAIGGLELLSGVEATDMPPAVLSGCFVMAPFAGRLRDGAFEFRGQAHQMPLNLPPHAIHGTVLDRPWVMHTEAMTVDLGSWPFAGTLRQELALRPDGLDARLVLHADEAMPATLGWHPWFARQLPRGGPLQLEFRPKQQYVRDEGGLTTPALIAPLPGPHDDCFVGVEADPVLLWPGALRLTMTSSAEHWVLFDERPSVLCLEPQTGAPGLVDAVVLEAGEELVLELRLQWEQL